MIVLKINGTEYRIDDVDPSTPLLWFLRDELNLVGTKFGCGIGECGACTVHVDGRPTRSCLFTLGAAAGAEITTIEGLARSDGSLHPLQQAWIDEDVAQCGYCQTGQLMSAAALLQTNPDPSDPDVDQAMAGNLCRCGTYLRVRRAIQVAARRMKRDATAADSPAEGEA
jgi:isoquinoline 1-oxidoreductase alpha subunit